MSVARPGSPGRAPLAALQGSLSRFRFDQLSWGVLGCTILVVLGGAFVRVTFSGDGCGTDWPTCRGQLLAPHTSLSTAIEQAHRLSTTLLVLLSLWQLVWAFRAFPRGSLVRRGAACVFLLLMVEAAIGAGLSKFGLVARDRSVYRAIAMPAHLVTTFLLLAAAAVTAWWGGRAIAMPAHLVTTFLLLAAAAVTAWWGGGAATPRLRGHGPLPALLGGALFGTLLLGTSGAITALGDTIFPARSLDEALHHALSPAQHFLLNLRVYHPVLAIAMGIYLASALGVALRLRPNGPAGRFGRLTGLLFAAQIGVGFLNLALLAPAWMQLVHLLMADLFWISLVLLTATALVPQAESAEAPAPVTVATPARRATWRDYLALTKPRVISLLLLTTLAAMAVAAGGPGLRTPGVLVFMAVAAGLYMAAGAANAINMVLERDLDSRMGRTASRPTVTDVIPPRAALVFAAVLACGSFALLWAAANLLCAFLAFAGLAFYVVVYTMLLKRRTWANIVIGGAAGAFPPLVGWAAVTGDLSPLAWCLFGIVFLWTPVHFWALALLMKEDYARAGVPMLPVVRGVRATVVQIAAYALLTVAVSILPLALGGGGQSAVGWFYLAAAVVLNAVLLIRSFGLFRNPDAPHARSLFKYSMLYLALLFLAMAVDRGPWV